MSLKFFDTSPEMAPYLVRLQESHDVYRMSRPDSKTVRPEARKELINAVSGLLEFDLKEREEELLSDVLIGLLMQAELDLREALSQRLSHMTGVPLRLVLYLSNQEVSVAGPMLRSSPVLSDKDLVYIIKSCGAEHWQEIARREDLSDEVIDMLADTKDLGTAIRLSRNERVALTHHALKIMTELAKDSDQLVRPLLMREDFPEKLARELYKFVAQDIQDYIDSFYGVDGRIKNAVSEVIEDHTKPQEEVVIGWGARLAALDDAREAARKGELGLGRIIEGLREGNITNFIAEFSVYTGIEHAKLKDVICEAFPKRLVMLARAHGIQKNDFTAIYLHTHRMRAPGESVNQQDLTRLLRYFDDIRPEVADRMLHQSMAV